MSPIRSRVWDGTDWRPYGGAATPIDPDRTLIVRGAHIPVPDEVGPLPSYLTFTQVEGGSTSVISLTQANAIYDGCEFWGQVSFRAPGIRITNSILRGPQPGLTIMPGIKNYGAGFYHGILENCTINPYGWYEQRGYPLMTAAAYQNRPGVHGGDVEMRWCHIKNVEDGFGWVQDDDLASDAGNTGYNNGAGWVTPAGQRFTILDRCLIEDGSYVNGPGYQAKSFAQSGGSPHSDAFQFNIGRNLWITGTKLGGPRTPSALQTWGTDASNPAESKDFSNSALMIQQEGAVYDPSNPRYVQNVLIEDSFVGGGNATINMNYKYGNNLVGVTLRRLKMYQRGANWGVFMDDGTLTNQNGGYGYYLAKGSSPSSLASTWSDITVLETGAALPFTNG